VPVTPLAEVARLDHDPAVNAESVRSADHGSLMDTAQPSRPRPDGLDVAKLELRRARRRALVLVVAAYLTAIVGLGILSLVGTPGDRWGAALFLAFVAMAPLLAAFTWLSMRRRFWPGVQALRWANGSASAAWTAIDGGRPPADADEALGRLADRVDDDALAMRAVWLAWANRTTDLRALLDIWRPLDPVVVARRARAESTLRLLEGETDDLGPAWEAAMAIPDPRHRTEQQAMVLVEDSRRRAEAGEDPFPRLVEAYRLLGPRASEFDTDEDWQGIRRARLMVAIWGLVPAVIFAVIGLAVWSGILG
jgi:hypothetical protein